MGMRNVFNRIFAPHKALDKLNDKGQTLLTRAVEESDRISIRNLLDAGANIDAKDGMGRTPLALAIMANDHAIVETLLERGANPGKSFTDADGTETLPLNVAAEKGDMTLAKKLLRARAFPSTKDGNGQSAIDVAKETGHDEMAVIFEDFERREKARIDAIARYGHFGY